MPVCDVGLCVDVCCSETPEKPFDLSPCPVQNTTIIIYLSLSRFCGVFGTWALWLCLGPCVQASIVWCAESHQLSLRDKTVGFLDSGHYT